MTRGVGRIGPQYTNNPNVLGAFARGIPEETHLDRFDRPVEMPRSPAFDEFTRFEPGTAVSGLERQDRHMSSSRIGGDCDWKILVDVGPTGDVTLDLEFPDDLVGVGFEAVHRVARDRQIDGSLGDFPVVLRIEEVECGEDLAFGDRYRCRADRSPPHGPRGRYAGVRVSLPGL